MGSSVGGPAFQDLTGRARIRDAALHSFADRGVEGTTIRDIAREAGVSGGLVRHHFGSKDDLRTACDSYVLSQLMRIKEQAVVEGEIADPGFIKASQPALLVIFRYFARSMLDGSPSADAMFAEMVELAEHWLADHHPGKMSDPSAYAALLVAMEIGTLVMAGPLSRALGADVFEAEGHLRLARAKVDFYSKPLLGPELARNAHAALEQLQAGSSPPKRRSRTLRAR